MGTPSSRRIHQHQIFIQDEPDLINLKSKQNAPGIMTKIIVTPQSNECSPIRMYPPKDLEEHHTEKSWDSLSKHSVDSINSYIHPNTELATNVELIAEISPNEINDENHIIWNNTTKSDEVDKPDLSYSVEESKVNLETGQSQKSTFTIQSEVSRESSNNDTSGRSNTVNEKIIIPSKGTDTNKQYKLKIDELPLSPQVRNTNYQVHLMKSFTVQNVQFNNIYI